MKNLFSLIIITLFFFTSCQKESILPSTITNNNNGTSVTNNQNENFQQIVTSVAGQILDRNNDPIEGAWISFGEKNTVTDQNGIFKIDDATVIRNRAYVKVFKEGYFHGSRNYVAFPNQRSFVKIVLLKKQILGNVNSTGGKIEMSNGVKLSFPPNAIAQADGTIYTGIVDVAVQYLDPMANDIFEIMPGNLRGISDENTEEGMTTYGMLAVELIGSGGEILNVADGKMVELIMPVAAEQLGEAPSEIPLWYFDEDAGIWKEEGAATLIDGKYVGNVSHFTFWNCDIGWDLIYLDGTVLLDGVGLENANVKLSFVSGPTTFSASESTSEVGYFSGEVPVGTIFDLEIYPPGNPCGTPIYTSTIGPFFAATTLLPIEVADFVIYELNVSGTITDCDDDPITDGYVRVRMEDSEYFSYTEDGSIDYTLVHCYGSGDIEITVFDLNELTQSDPSTYAYTDLIEFGELSSCEDLEEYIIYDLDGTTYNLLESVMITGTGAQPLSGNDNMQNYLSLSADEEGIGTYLADEFFMNSGGINAGGIGTAVNITYTSFSDVIGETCKGTFEGTVVDSAGTPYPISGSFSAIRE